MKFICQKTTIMCDCYVIWTEGADVLVSLVARCRTSSEYDDVHRCWFAVDGIVPPMTGAGGESKLLQYLFCTAVVVVILLCDKNVDYKDQNNYDNNDQPYKHSTSSQPVGRQGLATTGQ